MEAIEAVVFMMIILGAVDLMCMARDVDTSCERMKEIVGEALLAVEDKMEKINAVLTRVVRMRVAATEESGRDEEKYEKALSSIDSATPDAPSVNSRHIFLRKALKIALFFGLRIVNNLPIRDQIK